MSREGTRDLVHNAKAKIMARLSRGYDIQALLSYGTGHKVGERVTLRDGTEYVVKNADCQHRETHYDEQDNKITTVEENPNKGTFVKITNNFRRYRKAKLIEPQYPEVKFFDRQHLHIDKTTRKAMSAQEILAMREKLDPNFLVNHPVEDKKESPLGEVEVGEMPKEEVKEV